MKQKAVSLCGTHPDDSTCPVVSISPTEVTIGEDANTVHLKKEAWNKLVELIRTGKLNKA